MGNTLRISLERVPSVIIACFILYNLAKRWRYPDFEEDDYAEAEDGDCDEELPPKLFESRRQYIAKKKTRKETRDS